LPFLLVGGAAFDNGGFDTTTWGWLTLVPLVVVAVAVLLNRVRRPGGLEVASPSSCTTRPSRAVRRAARSNSGTRFASR
jgi:hypothetical protein